MVNRFVSPAQQFFVNPVTGAPLSGGFLFFYASGTDTPLNTYSDMGLAIPNSNPVELDSAGIPETSIFMQDLAYKVVLTDENLVQQWTYDPVYCSDFSTYAQVQPVNGSPNGQLAGNAATAGMYPGTSMAWDYVNNILYVCTVTGDTTTAVWTAVNAATTAAVVPAPTGYLSAVSGTPIITTDQVGMTSLVYTSYLPGDTVPVYSGSAFTTQTFSELTLTLTASQAANTLYDVFVFNNSGVLTLVFGPAWANSAAGTSSRGTGAGTAQISRLTGIWVNTVQITGRNGASTYTIPPNQATYLGTVYTDATAGQYTCHRTWGQNRKFGIWNAYNRAPIILKSGDSTSTWTYGSGAWRSINGAPATFASTSYNVGSGTACNGITVMAGLAESLFDSVYSQVYSSGSAQAQTRGNKNSIGWNTITAPTGTTPATVIASLDGGTVVGGASSNLAVYSNPPTLGINIVTQMEQCVSLPLASVGTENGCVLTVSYLG